jgi:6-phosphogluconolactonase
LNSARVQWQVLPDAAGVAQAAAVAISAAAAAAIAARGRFRLVLAGGRTPAAAYRLLGATAQQWDTWQIYFGDERCLPPEHAERNSRLALQAWLGQVAVPASQVHLIPAELGAEPAAARYAATVAAAAPFDLVLLGIGEDGHTASLFPGRVLDPDAWTVAVHDAPKPPPQRVSLGLRALRASRATLVLATGAGKQDAIAAWRRGAALPIAAACAGVPTQVLLDAAAAGE